MRRLVLALTAAIGALAMLSGAAAASGTDITGMSVTCLPNGPADAFQTDTVKWGPSTDNAVRWWHTQNDCFGPGFIQLDYFDGSQVIIAVEHGTDRTLWAHKLQTHGIRVQRVQGVGDGAGLRNACDYGPSWLFHRDGTLTPMTHCPSPT